MKKVWNGIAGKLYCQNEKIKNKVQEMLTSEKGGIDQYASVLIILGVTLIIGWLIWHYVDDTGGTAISEWFSNNITNITELQTDSQ